MRPSERRGHTKVPSRPLCAKAACIFLAGRSERSLSAARRRRSSRSLCAFLCKLSLRWSGVCRSLPACLRSVRAQHAIIRRMKVRHVCRVRRYLHPARRRFETRISNIRDSITDLCDPPSHDTAQAAGVQRSSAPLPGYDRNEAGRETLSSLADGRSMGLALPPCYGLARAPPHKYMATEATAKRPKEAPAMAMTNRQAFTLPWSSAFRFGRELVRSDARPDSFIKTAGLAAREELLLWN